MRPRSNREDPPRRPRYRSSIDILDFSSISLGKVSMAWRCRHSFDRRASRRTRAPAFVLRDRHDARGGERGGWRSRKEGRRRSGAPGNPLEAHGTPTERRRKHATKDEARSTNAKSRMQRTRKEEGSDLHRRTGWREVDRTHERSSKARRNARAPKCEADRTELWPRGAIRSRSCKVSTSRI